MTIRVHRLERQGLIESFERIGDNNKKRKYYRLKVNGGSVFARRLFWMIAGALAWPIIVPILLTVVLITLRVPRPGRLRCS